MATTTLNTNGLHLSGSAKFFQGIWNSYQENRSREAKQRVVRYLRTLSDEHLAALSFSEAEIRAVRAGRLN